MIMPLDLFRCTGNKIFVNFLVCVVPHRRGTVDEFLINVKNTEAVFGHVNHKFSECILFGVEKIHEESLFKNEIHLLDNFVDLFGIIYADCVKILSRYFFSITEILH